MIARLHALPLRVQIVVMLAAAPVVVTTAGLPLLPMAVEVALAGEDAELVSRVVRSVRIVLGVVLLAGTLAAAGAAAVLWSAITRLLGDLCAATAAIAGGEFDHQLELNRRDELGQLADAVDGMARRLGRLERSRRVFMAALSHELRTPLTIIRGQAWTLHRSEADESRRDRMALVDREAQRVASLLTELMEASTILAAGVRLDLRSVSLVDVVRDAVERFEPLAADAGLHLQVETGARGAAWVDADPDRLQQVLGNLLANALAHAPRDSTVCVSCYGVDDGLLVAVANTGEPISPAILPSVFEPFVQGRRRSGSCGLGLAVARDLVVAHGGRISARSDPSGTTFSVHLPHCANLRACAAPAGAAHAAADDRIGAAGLPAVVLT